MLSYGIRSLVAPPPPLLSSDIKIRHCARNGVRSITGYNRSMSRTVYGTSQTILLACVSGGVGGVGWCRSLSGGVGLCRSLSGGVGRCRDHHKVFHYFTVISKYYNRYSLQDIEILSSLLVLYYLFDSPYLTVSRSLCVVEASKGKDGGGVFGQDLCADGMEPILAIIHHLNQAKCKCHTGFQLLVSRRRLLS